jgi:hypothetical protein
MTFPQKGGFLYNHDFGEAAPILCVRRPTQIDSSTIINSSSSSRTVLKYVKEFDLPEIFEGAAGRIEPAKV